MSLSAAFDLRLHKGRRDWTNVSKVMSGAPGSCISSGNLLPLHLISLISLMKLNRRENKERNLALITNLQLNKASSAKGPAWLQHSTAHDGNIAALPSPALCCSPGRVVWPQSAGKQLQLTPFFLQTVWWLGRADPSIQVPARRHFPPGCADPRAAA